MGGGVAGLATALLLGRDGHDTTLVERDDLAAGELRDAPGWNRRGIPHFLQPHLFIPRGRVELRAHLPDVFEALLAAGAWDVDVRRKLPGDVEPGDEELQYLAVRRPLIEWGLRRAVLQEPGVTVRSGVTITGLRATAGRVEGIDVDGTSLDADLVVDALGRRSPTSTWLEQCGAKPDEREVTDCGVIYYSRYYRTKDGFELPDGPWVLSPRGDLGYLAYASFPGDNGTFAALLSVPTGVPEWRAFGHADVFEAAIARIPALRLWVDPHGVEPSTDVMPMAGLQNTLRAYGPTSARGLVPVGDAFSHTDPVLAHGLSFGLIHARELATALREHDSVDDACDAFSDRATPWLRERFELASEMDKERLAQWRGEISPAGGADAPVRTAMAAAGAVAMVDPDVFRAFVRRMGLLDSTAVLDDDEELQRRIAEKSRELQTAPRPPAGPSRDEMLAIATGSA